MHAPVPIANAANLVLTWGYNFRAGSPAAVPESGRSPAFFIDVTEETVTVIQQQIEARLATVEPDVEVLLAEVVSGSTLRLFIDHPDGVTLALCERISGHLNDYRDRYALEVSSPGQDRPLTKPQHYSRFLGRRVRLRLRSECAGRTPTAKRSVNLTGELVGASEQDVTIAADDGLVTIPYEQIARSNLVPGD
jgi:ribosome maturation factor RimP